MTFTVTYSHLGKTHKFDLPGATSKEARHHLNSAYYNGEIEEVVARVTVPEFIGRMIGGGH